jgi:hypothetical protein
LWIAKWARESVKRVLRIVPFVREIPRVQERSIKRRRKRAAWDPQYLLDTLGPLQPKPC